MSPKAYPDVVQQGLLWKNFSAKNTLAYYNLVSPYVYPKDVGQTLLGYFWLNRKKARENALAYYGSMSTYVYHKDVGKD